MYIPSIPYQTTKHRGSHWGSLCDNHESSDEENHTISKKGSNQGTYNREAGQSTDEKTNLGSDLETDQSTDEASNKETDQGSVVEASHK